MSKPVKALNPFYPLLVVAGLVFAVTACAYGVMTVKMLDPASVAEVDSPFVKFLDQRGLYLMIGELIVLAVITAAAMATDSFWASREKKLPQANGDVEPKP